MDQLRGVVEAQSNEIKTLKWKAWAPLKLPPSAGRDANEDAKETNEIACSSGDDVEGDAKEEEAKETT